MEKNCQPATFHSRLPRGETWRRSQRTYANNDFFLGFSLFMHYSHYTKSQYIQLVSDQSSQKKEERKNRNYPKRSSQRSPKYGVVPRLRDRVSFSMSVLHSMNALSIEISTLVVSGEAEITPKSRNFLFSPNCAATPKWPTAGFSPRSAGHSGHSGWKVSTRLRGVAGILN